MSRRRFREHLPFAPRHERYFRWRGGAVSRLENLADAAFGFALTLLVVSTEVPRTFDGLLRVLREVPAFAACFALLLLFWNEHYKFFRRYGLEDTITRVLNYAILMLVLFSVYPLKFLFTAWLGGGSVFVSYDDVLFVFKVYGLGFATLWTLFACLQAHAIRRADVLRLTPVERIMSHLQLNEFRIQIGVCFLSIGLAYLAINAWLPGVIYAAIGPLAGINGWWHGRQIDAVLAQSREPAR